jgi:RNA polymerase sigma factor (sigma-70 family)
VAGIQRKQAGAASEQEEEAMTSAQEQLITDNYALAPYCAKRFAPLYPMIEHEDLLSLAHIGMVEAAKMYDPEKGKFANFAIITIKLRYRSEMTIRKSKKRTANLVDLDERIKASDIHDLDLSIDVRNTLDEAMRGMGKRECQFFVLHYIYEYSLREIGRMYGLSYERVRQLTERVTQRFRMFWELDHRGEAV